MSPAERWRTALQAWVIPSEILEQAPESPWVHPPGLFAAAAPDMLADSPSHRAARAALDAGGTVLDVGCGGGRSSLPLASSAQTVTGVDENAAMLINFATAFERAGVPHREILGKWPDVAAIVERADVVVCHHVVYNVADIGPFLRALTDHAERRVVVELPEHHPMSALGPLWSHFWNVDQPTEPLAGLFVEVVESLGHRTDIERVRRPPRKPTLSGADYHAFVRRRLCLPADRDGEIVSQLALMEAQRDDFTFTVSWAGSRAKVSSRS